MSNIKADSVDGFLILMKFLILKKKDYMNWTDSKVFTDWLWNTVYRVNK